ncbi:MAG TPA: competence/damage-inducible protein A [Bacillota bacterium]|nr:competence/damage-inducible protein A [Bacillota bacterium]HNT02454.1 competence/damage-inducible protein A [Bacillota bacterium]HPA54263.1 competence/damage-inducible protein A [Bacillota bacterium]HPX68393.1 competence/damage-inducible protein A [Bacillota bacterium]HQA65616.1 competence/damage-inducible protein A [Bacillota bacterium]
MKSEIIAVGTELLLGNIVNTNAQYLSQKLADLGIDVYYHVVVGDNLKRLTETIKTSLERSDIVITSGGLGPTADDITKEGAAQAMGLKLLPDEESIERIKKMFSSTGRIMTENNIKQGYIPEGAVVLENNNGTAPGVLIEKEGKIVIMLPGPPKELYPMFESKVLPYLKSKTDSTIRSKVLRVIGVGESAVEHILKDIFDSQANPTIAPYAKDGEVHLRITAKTGIPEEADSLIAEMEQKVRAILGDNIYGCNEETLEEAVLKLLQKKNLTISLAESCTGGLVASRLTDIPGASASLISGVISYSNESKINMLKVKEETIRKYGAVSPQTAEEMAVGAKRLSNTDIGLSITGIAGPDGGSVEKPVGLCYIGIAIGKSVNVQKIMLTGNRNRIRWGSSSRALDFLRRELLSG